MKSKFQNNCLKIAIMFWIIPVILWLTSCSGKQFFKTYEIDNIKICITDDPTRYRPFPKAGAKYNGFTLLDSNTIYVRGWESNGKITPDYETLGHEISCLLRDRDRRIQTLYYED